MRDDLPFFSHDNDARNHAKMKALRSRYGWTGYGQFWALNEMIADSAGARLDLSRKVVRASAACELGMTPDAFDDFLKFLCDRDECGLIHYDDGIVTTDRTQEDYEKVVSSRDQRSIAGKASADKRWKKVTPVKESVTAVTENDNGRSTVVQRPVTKCSQQIQQNRIERVEENRIDREDAREPLTFDGFLKTFIDAWRDSGCKPPFSDVLSVNLTTDEREKFAKASARIKDISRALKAIQNYSEIQKSPDHETHGSFKLPGFLISGVDDFADEADPWTRYRKKSSGEQTAEERRAMIAKIAAEVKGPEKVPEVDRFSDDDEGFADDSPSEPFKFDSKRVMSDIRRQSGNNEARRA